MKLTWAKGEDKIFGTAFELHGMPETDSASARRSGDRYVAHGWIGGRYLNHHAGTLAAAMRRLECEIDRRSIGLFGIDDVEFSKS